MNHRLAADPRVVLTLDAGGTSFRFNAIRGGRLLLEPIRMPTQGDRLEACLDQLVAGFEAVRAAVDGEAVALSFGFPGPADYAAGIIGDLPNFASFRGGVPIGPMLAAHFHLPTFVNNDGSLFAFGESLGGLLPWANAQLEAAGRRRRLRQLLGFTFGTGFGGGLVVEGRLVRGDCSATAQVWTMRHRDQRNCFVEEGVSIRAVRRAYAEAAGLPLAEAPEPREIAAIADGTHPGEVAAAREAFRRLGEAAGDAIAHALALVDGLVVLGGGLAAARAHYMPALVRELNGQLRGRDGAAARRLVFAVEDLDDPRGLEAFVQGERRLLPVRGAAPVPHEPARCTGIGLSRLGTSEAIALGAYAFALEQLPG